MRNIIRTRKGHAELSEFWLVLCKNLSDLMQTLQSREHYHSAATSIQALIMDIELPSPPPVSALRESFGDRKPPDITRKITACVACRKQKVGPLEVDDKASN